MLWTVQISWFFLKCLPIHFSIHRWTVTKVDGWWFSISLIPSTFMNCKCSRRKNCPFSLIHFFVQLFIYINTDSWILLDSMRQKSVLPWLIFLLKLYQLWPWGAASCWHPCPFIMPPITSVHFLPFWHHKMFQAHLVISQSRPWNQPFLLGALVPIFEEWYLDNQVLD